MEGTIREAEDKDAKRLESFLLEANLDTDGIAEGLDYFSLLETKSGTLKACVGIEPVGSLGMLRSFVLSQGTSQTEIMLLFDRVIRIAERKKLTGLYLATNKESAVAFFKGIGFQQMTEIPADLQTSTHYQQVLNVDNSVIMGMHL